MNLNCGCYFESVGRLVKLNVSMVLAAGEKMCGILNSTSHTMTRFSHVSCSGECGVISGGEQSQKQR